LHSGFKGGTFARDQDFVCSTTLDANIETTMIVFYITTLSDFRVETSMKTRGVRSSIALARGFQAVWNKALLPSFTPPSAPVLNKEAAPSRPPRVYYNFDDSVPSGGSGGGSPSLPPRFIAAIVISAVGTVAVFIGLWVGIAIRRKKRREAKRASQAGQGLPPQVIYVPVYIQGPPGDSPASQDVTR
jgi:hypothetical protein